MWNVPAPIFLSTRRAQRSLPWRPTTKPSTSQDLSASQVHTAPLKQNTPIPAPQLIRFLFLSLLRLCVGHLIPLAVLPFPHVCCQTAHSHDGELPWNPGNTDLLISPCAYCYTSSANSHSSLLVYPAEAFVLPHRLHYFLWHFLLLLTVSLQYRIAIMADA